jgi:hypothetical protein
LQSQASARARRKALSRAFRASGRPQRDQPALEVDVAESHRQQFAAPQRGDLASANGNGAAFLGGSDCLEDRVTIAIW